MTINIKKLQALAAFEALSAAEQDTYIKAFPQSEFASGTKKFHKMSAAEQKNFAHVHDNLDDSLAVMQQHHRKMALRHDKYYGKSKEHEAAQTAHEEAEEALGETGRPIDLVPALQKSHKANAMSAKLFKKK
jgi:hypothetical protein